MNAIETQQLTKRYGARVALRECTLAVPEGRVVGVVGTNGAGKSTLLHLAVGLLRPSAGSIRVLGTPPASGPDQLSRVGFLGQEAPVYRALTVGEHLHLGASLNPRWDGDFAQQRLAKLGLEPRVKAGRLSGGQRSQLALSLAMAKRPDLLVLDEPAASLDPLARREFLGDLMALVAEHQPSVILASHSLADVERVCDHLVVIADGQVRLDGAIDDLLDEHRRLTGPRDERCSLPPGAAVVHSSSTDRQTTVVVRSRGRIVDPRWNVSTLNLEDLALAYLSTTAVTQHPTAPTLVEVPR